MAKARKLTFNICSSVCLVLVATLLFINSSAPGEARIYLFKKLMKIEPPHEKATSRSKTVIYILGGSEKSLKFKFKKAAELYHAGVCNKIFILSQPGITAYDPDLRRNLTNDEWAVKELTALDVKGEDIEAVPVNSGFFGTLTEARGITGIVMSRGYRQLILVTSNHHTLRTWLSFSHFLEDKKVALYLYGSDEEVSLRELLVEYLKLFLYKDILLPMSTKTSREESQSFKVQREEKSVSTGNRLRHDFPVFT